MVFIYIFLIFSLVTLTSLLILGQISNSEKKNFIFKSFIKKNFLIRNFNKQ